MVVGAMMRLGVGGAGVNYAAKVLSYSPIAYWPLWEPSGGVAEDLVNSAQNGAYTGVTLGQPGIGDGNTCPLFDSVNDFVNIYSATLATAFNPAEGTMMIWSKVFDVGVWTDAKYRAHMTIKADNQNRIMNGRTNTNNQVRQHYKAGNVTEQILRAGLTSLDWIVWHITWSRIVENQVRTYVNGGSEQTSATLGTWVGALAANACNIGADLSTPTDGWHGWLAHGAVWDTPLASAQIADLVVV